MKNAFFLSKTVTSNWMPEKANFSLKAIASCFLIELKVILQCRIGYDLRLRRFAFSPLTYQQAWYR